MIGPTETRALTIHVSETVYATLITKARTESKTPALYAKLLFEAAWAARCGKAEGDPILVDCVDKSLRRRPAAEAPARAPKPIAPPPVVRWVPVPVIVPVAVPVPVSVAAAEEPASPATEDPTSLNPTVLIRRVKALASAGNRPKEIAQRLGVDLMLVRGVLSGKVA